MIIQKIMNYFYSKHQSSEYIINNLIKNGVKVGENVHVFSTGIDSKYGPMIEIDDDVTISTNVTVLAHDASTKKYIGYTKIKKVHIGKKCFVGSGSIILPGTFLGNECIVGAGSVVRGNYPDNSIIVGNPARVVGNTNEYIDRYRDKLNGTIIYDDNSIDDMIRAAKELGTDTGFVI